MTVIERKQVGRTHEWFTARGSLRIERLGRELIVYKPSGYTDESLLDLFEQITNEAIAEGRPSMFWDGEAMTGYSSQFRERIGHYCQENKPRVTAMILYTPNPLVAMGASVINVWLGGFFQITKSRAEFDRQLNALRAPSLRSTGAR
jgi:hypothetical protein